MPNPDFTNDERFDGLYLQVANTARGIEPMLDTVFSFLRRKTDFFNGPSGEGTDIATETVNRVLQKHVQIYEQIEGKKKAKVEAAARKKKEAAEVERVAKLKKIDAKKEQEKAAAVVEEDVIELGQDGFDISTMPKSAETTELKKESKSESSENVKQSPHPSEKENDEKNDVADDTPPPPGNGGTVEGKYVWTQSLQELNVSVPLPDNTRGRDLNVTIQKEYLKVGLKSHGPSNLIIDAPLTKAIICDDSFWTIEDGNRLVLNLQKLNQMEWWESVCVGDPTIDIKKVQPENSQLGDLDSETRQTVEKMMFDQRQKAMGKPSSDEMRKHEMFEKFKKSHPEMDFSNAKIS